MKPATVASGRSLLTLNDDILLAIVSFLPQEDSLNLSHTARGIYSIAMRQVNPKLRKLSVSMSQGDLDPMDLFEGLTRFSNLQTLVMRGEEEWRAGSQRSRIPVIPSIKRLDLHRCQDVSGLRLSPVRLSFTLWSEPLWWETLLGNLPRLRVLEVKLINVWLEPLIQWTVCHTCENMLCLLPAHIACLKMVYSVLWQISIDPETLHSLPQLVANSIPSMELFAVGLADCLSNRDQTHWTRIRVNGDNQRVVEAIDPTTGEESLSRISSRFHESLTSTG
ncbi:hypothetical protein IEO21_06776 [Rhodonia placenta]|uniref:F-box domain-containing protein n=1 Tax=Rhodonia placenta TaxID=104341 RepID=A0A8H7U0U5_9APHY|nr:hypothetical protein IEO21_06776 [Postia placenta]